MLKREVRLRCNDAVLMMPAGTSGWVQQQPIKGAATESSIEKH